MCCYREGLKSSDMSPDRRIPHITRGYRVGGTHFDNLLSLFSSRSNQTMNAWTMIAGGAVSTYAYSYALGGPLRDAGNTHDYLVFTAFWLSCVVHVPLSVGNHLFTGMSREVALFWKKMDVIGIFLVSVLLTFSLSHYVMSWRGTLSLVSLSGSLFLVATRTILSHEYAPGSVQRGTHSVGVAAAVLIYLFPMLYQVLSLVFLGRGSGGDNIDTASICSATLYAVASLALGMLLFVKHWPEAWYPLRFDLCMPSQALMHVTLILAHLAEFQFLLVMFLLSAEERKLADHI